MPLFPNKFTPKKLPLRKKESETLKECSSLAEKDIEPISLDLESFRAVFENGDWIPESEEGGHQELHKLKESLKEMEEENYLLTVKNELLLHMITKTEIQNRKNQKKVKELKKTIKKLVNQIKGK